MKIAQIKKYLDEISGLDLSSKSQETDYIKYRSKYYFLCVKYATDANSYAKIGKQVDKDHATVMNGLKTFESFMMSNTNFVSRFRVIEKHISMNMTKRHSVILNNIDSMSLELIKAQLLKSKMTIINKNNTIHNLRKKNVKLSEYKVKYKNLTELNICLN